jgi:hypothetical protein
MGASRGHGQYPAPPQSRTSIGTQPRIISPGPVPGFFPGPVNEIAGRLWNLHEFGGMATKRRKLKPHRFRVGEHGPIRIKQHGNKTKFARIELRTAAQANRATRLIAEENERRSDNKPRHYPKPPFMKPALDANWSRLPMFWGNSVK